MNTPQKAASGKMTIPATLCTEEGNSLFAANGYSKLMWGILIHQTVSLNTQKITKQRRSKKGG
jgi:hypothetical protein